ncbi:MAG: mannose-1-phosphate guanylyltransferase [Paludibacteraceae bacterium]|jgi:mannose-1-phosphate guanylyltransferase
MKNNNYCIIMAGGVGSRFWPFSRTSKPKQFLDFFGTGRSLLQMTFERFAKLIPTEQIYIVSNLAYKELILQQLPAISENQVLLEPLRRNTAPCLAYAVHKIKSVAKSANIIVAPSDHLILNENEFLRVLKKGLEHIEFNNELLTLGIQPTRPETGYGYIQVKPGATNLREVKTFTEKPNLEMAKIFVASGEFYWNSGMFMFNLETILNAFANFLPNINSKFQAGETFYNTDKEAGFIQEVYSLCPNISIDYGIMEKADNVSVLIADFGWSDLGTWDSLHELADKDASQNAVLKGEAILYNSQNNVISLPEGKLVVADGLEGYLIAESGDVLLICKKDSEAKIRDYLKDVETKFGDKYI